MIKKEKKDRRFTLRLPSSIYQQYEKIAIEEHLFISEMMREAIEQKVRNMKQYSRHQK
jgi:predicted DNA-binding protein